MIRRRISVTAVVALLNLFTGEAFRLGGIAPLKNRFHLVYPLLSQNDGDTTPSLVQKISADVDDGKLGTSEPRKSYETFGKFNI